VPKARVVKHVSLSKTNKKAHVAKACAPKKNLKSSGGLGINTHARLHSRAFFQGNIYPGGFPRPSGPWTCSGKGRKRVPGRCGGNKRKREPEHTALGGMRTRDHHGRVGVSEMTLSGAAHCSGRGRARGGTHSDANAHAAGCLAMSQPGSLRMDSREWNDPQWGRAQGHAQRRECARSRDAVPFCFLNLLNEKLT